MKYADFENMAREAFNGHWERQIITRCGVSKRTVKRWKDRNIVPPRIEMLLHAWVQCVRHGLFTEAGAGNG